MATARNVSELKTALARGCGASTAKAASVLYRLAGQGAEHGNSIRSEGGIPALLAVMQDEDVRTHSKAAEDSLGTLAHLVMQGTANQESLVAAGALRILVDLLCERRPEDQCARYADSMLTVMAMASQSNDVKLAVTEACAALPTDRLEDYQELAMFTGRGGDHHAAVQQQQQADWGTKVMRFLKGESWACQPPAPRSLGPDSVNMCAICISEIEGDDPITELPCGHCYHSTCVHSWLRQSATCPMCRCEVSNARR